jgi:hypothetical protein
MASKTYFPDALPLSQIDVSKIYFDKQIKGQSKSAASIVYDRIPIKYKLGDNIDQVLTFELKTEGKIKSAILDGKHPSYTMILKTAKGMDTPTDEEQANIGKLQAIEECIQELVRKQKVILKTSKNAKTGKLLDPDDLVILARKTTQQGDPMNPVIFAKIYAEEGKISLGDNFRKLNTKAEYIRTNGRCGIHTTANPDNYQDGWMNLIAVVKVSGIFIGNVQNIQVRLAKVIIINKIKNVPLINASIQDLMPGNDEEEEEEEETSGEGSASESQDNSDEATITIIET